MMEKLKYWIDVVKISDHMKWFEFDAGIIKFQLGEDSPSKLTIINKISTVLIWLSLIITIIAFTFFNIDIGLLDLKNRTLIVFIMLLLLLGTCQIKIFKKDV